MSEAVLKESTPAGVDHSTDVSFYVRYAETDAMGIVHHSNYLIWFEAARSAFVRARGVSYATLENSSGVALAVSEATLRYLKSARYEQRITVRCRLEAIQSRKLTFSYTVFDAESGETLALGQTNHICVTADGQVTRVPASWKAIFQQPDEAHSPQ